MYIGTVIIYWRIVPSASEEWFVQVSIGRYIFCLPGQQIRIVSLVKGMLYSQSFKTYSCLERSREYFCWVCWQYRVFFSSPSVCNVKRVFCLVLFFFFIIVEWILLSFITIVKNRLRMISFSKTVVYWTVVESANFLRRLLQRQLITNVECLF